MKTIPPPCPEPESGQKYWRSLDQLADTPEFRQWLVREFPDGASEFTDPVSRRNFVKLMSASFLLGGLGVLGSGCRRPEEKIMPFGKMPEGYVHGVPQYFATAMPSRGGAIPLLVKSHENRPTKIEGNPQHPDSNGATDTFAQASLLSLYDPDRAQRFAQFGNTITREKMVDVLMGLAARFGAKGGAGLAFLLEQSSSPSRLRLQYALQQKYPQAKWVIYEPVDLEGPRRLTGSTPYYKLEQANVLLSLDADFVGSEADSCRLIRGFSRKRKLQKASDPMNRLYVVEGLYSLTGLNADHRLRVATSQVASVAAHLAAKIAPDNAAITELARRVTLPAGVEPKWIDECAADLKANAGASVVLAGHRQPAAVHVLAGLLNAALGNHGKTVFFSEIPQAPTTTDLAGLVRDLNAGQVETLVILGGNPALTAPADLNWAEAQKKVTAEVVHLSDYEDETTASSWAVTLSIPRAHYLESWGDARTSDGTVVPIQPLVAPIFDGMTELEVLAHLGGMRVTKPYDIARETFRAFAGAGNFEEAWKKFLHDGFAAGAAPKSNDAPVGAEVIRTAFAAVNAGAPGKESLELVFHRDLRMDDGRWNNSGWLHEFPDPITKVTWDNVIALSRKTAEELAVKNGDVVEVEAGGRKLRGPAWIQPGLADYTLGLALGYGRTKNPGGGTGRIGHGVGYNAYALRATAGPSFAGGAKLTKTGEKHRVAVTQEHGSMDGRPIIREANKDDYAKHPRFFQRVRSGFTGGIGSYRQGSENGPAPGHLRTSLRRFREARQPIGGQAEGDVQERLASMGHVDRLEFVCGLRRLCAGLPERKQHSHRRQGPGAAQPGDELAAHRPLLQRSGDQGPQGIGRRSASSRATDALSALRECALRIGLPG
jgi:molybdopterin-containing oxidoreductase family iron-sulfur binding subunit